MKNKILLILLVITLVIPNVSMIQAASADYQESVNLVETLGIINSQEAVTFKTDYITRDIFADKMFKLYNLPMGEWGESEKIFSDVSVDDSYYASIMYISKNKIMRGYQDGTFKPDYYITGAEAVVSFINFLGYAYKAETLGGYPSGYITTAKEIGLLKGISLDYSYKLSGAELAKLIDNALTIPLVELISTGTENTYSISENSTILKSYFKMERETGIVTANEFISISGSVSKEDCITVNGKNLKYTNPTCIEYLGKKVTVLYDDLKETVHNLIYIGISGEDNSLTFNIRDYVNSSKDLFVFANGEDEIKVKTVLNAKVFYNNGELVLKETLSDFISNIEDGKIQFVSTEGSKTYDVIFISEYKYIVADRIDAETYVINSKIKSKDEVCLDPEDCKIVIKDSKGNNKEFSDISEGNILTVIENKHYKYVVISDAIVSGILTSKTNTVNAYVTYIIDDKEYNMTTDRDKLYSGILLGNSVEIYVNNNNEIVYMKKVPVEGYETAYIVKTAKKTVADEDTIIAKFFTTSGKFVFYPFKEGFKINDVATEKKMTLEEFDKILESYNTKKNQLALIKTNEDGEIISMHLARSKDTLLAGNEDGLCLQHPAKVLTFLTGVNCFSYKIHVNSLSTPILIIPKDIENSKEKDFKVVDYTYLQNGLKPLVESYAYNKHSLSDDIVIVYSDDSMSATIDDEIYTHVVVSKTEAINDEGEVVTRIRVTDGSKETYFDVPDDSEVKTTSVFNKESKEYKATDLDKGDVIRFTTNSEGALLNFEFYYDADKNLFYEKNTKELIGNGLIIRDVAEIDSNWIAYLHGTYSETPTDYIKFNITNKNVKNRVIIVTKNNSAIKVRNGSTGEIKPGDKTISHILGNDISTIVVLRGFEEKK